MAGTSCPICGSPGREVAFTYDAPPAGEVRYDVFPEGKYHREYFRCKTCAHLHSSFRWPKKAVYEGGYVEATYAGLDGLRKTFAKIRALPPEKSDNVGRVKYVSEFWRAHGAASGEALDIGSGLGVFPYAMKAAGFRCAALDPDPVACRHLREDLGLETLEGDFHAVEPPRRFDLISFNKVLEHVDDPVAMLARGLRFLKPGGLAYVELPDAEASGRDSPGREELFIDHLHVFSFASMALLAARAGFEVLAMERLREPSTKYTLRGFFRPVGRP